VPVRMVKVVISHVIMAIPAVATTQTNAGFGTW
jgi:hypothetical protein